LVAGDHCSYNFEVNSTDLNVQVVTRKYDMFMFDFQFAESDVKKT